MNRSLAILLMIISFNLFADDLITKTIQLQYINANKIESLVQPILGPDERISGADQTLMVKVKPNTLTQIRNLVHQLDKPPITFEISVHQDSADWLNNQNSQNNEFSRSYSTQSQESQQRDQSVKVMNGESAFVSTGKDVPIVTSAGVGWWSAGVSYEQRPVQQGFIVEPSLQGQNVKLKIAKTRQQQSLTQSQQFDTQNSATTLMVPVNTWVAISSAQGSTTGEQDNNNIGRSYSTGNQYDQNSTLYVKVNIIGKQSSGIPK